MSNTVITNYTDLNGPSTKADSSVVVIVNKDGSLSVDQNLLGTLMGTDGSQGAGISVVRVGHEGRPDDPTDSENEDDKVPHVTLSVDSYFDEPNSIIKYDSGAEMLQSLRIETRENSLVGFQNDHCYTPLTSPSQGAPQRTDSYSTFDEPVIEITHTPPPPPKPIPSSKKITILEQQIIPKGKKLVLNPNDSPLAHKGSEALNKPLSTLSKVKLANYDKTAEAQRSDESSSLSSSGESIPDRDSDSDYKDTKDRSGSFKVKKSKLKPRILKSVHPSKVGKSDARGGSRLKINKTAIRREIKEKLNRAERKQLELDLSGSKDALLPTDGSLPSTPGTPAVSDTNKGIPKQTSKSIKKEKKTPAHVSALLSDMTSLFSTPDVIRRVSTENKVPTKPEKDVQLSKTNDGVRATEISDKSKIVTTPKAPLKQKDKVLEKVKGYDLIPQLDDASLAQILQDTTPGPAKQPGLSAANVISSPGLAGPLSPTLDQILPDLQPEEDGLTEDLLLHVARLVETSENLQEVIDKQVLGKVDTPTVLPKTSVQTPFQQAQSPQYVLSTPKSAKMVPKQAPIEIVRRDGRVITLPPIEAPTTRASKRKSQVETGVPTADTPPPLLVSPPLASTPEPHVQHVSKQYSNKKLVKKQEPASQSPPAEKQPAESQDSWNSEDDPNRLWCICKQPHNNRFMICCDGCEDWFHGKCVNITKAMGQQMEEQGIEWRCPNCVKKTKTTPKNLNKALAQQAKRFEMEDEMNQATTSAMVSPPTKASKSGCIVCKKPARASSIYCSDACILKHAQDSLGNPPVSKVESETGKTQDKQKTDSRVIVYERKSGRLLAGPNAPTAENLKAWLQKNPTFEVVRPGTLSTIKPNLVKKKAQSQSPSEAKKIQTTLNFERIPRKPAQLIKALPMDPKESMSKTTTPSKEDPKYVPQPKTPTTPRPAPDTPRPGTSTPARTPLAEPKKIGRASTSRTQPPPEKAPSVSPAASRRKEPLQDRTKMTTGDPIRENVRKALMEQMGIRMAENKDLQKFNEEEIQQFALDTELELHELFRDVGMKYKAKYRSLMFNIKDRKNQTLWEKICERVITPKQLVRLSPEELASQELAQWRDKEAKHQLELIKKSELDLLAASKTYVLKTHKGEEVMENKTSVSTELDPNVPVEDVVAVLNEGDEAPNTTQDTASSKESDKKHRKKDKEESSRSKRSRKDSKRDDRKSRSSRRKSEYKEREERSTRRSDKRSRRSRSDSKDKKTEIKEKSEGRARSRARSRSRGKSRRRSGSAPRERSTSRARTRSSRREGDERRRRRDASRTARDSVDDKHKLRSRSQDNVYTKSKNDSTDSDSIERPKSAMQKEVHPEYDPHEPMITSAFSEEDIRKSREDIYDESYKADYEVSEYDPAKSFAMDTSVTPAEKSSAKPDKAAETESDQEPSSTVEHSSATVWNGCINMVDVARFYVAAHEVSGSGADLEEDLTTELDIVGRINPDTVWEYIGKMKRASNKDIIVLRLQAANDEEKMQYIALYSYLSSRNRLGVVKVSSTTNVKDFYIVPLSGGGALPSVLQPLDGPGLDARTHLLLAIVIRQRKKRAPPLALKDPVPAKIARTTRKRSYTPPGSAGAARSPSPRRRLPLPYTSPALTNTVKDKIAQSLASTADDEPYSPGSSGSGNSLPLVASNNPNTLRDKMDELNRQIEEQKQQIRKMAQADSSVPGEDEAYSPSRPMTPVGGEAVAGALADIALPSNLHEILATIKQRSEGQGDVDMRQLHP